MRKKKDNIEYFELSEKELKIYKGCAFRSLRIRLIFFCLLIPIYIIYCIELFGKFSIPFIRCTAVFMGFFIGFFGTWIYRFAGKPRGARHGRVSKKIRVSAGKYSGYTFNIYFEDIHKSLTRQSIYITKEHPVIMRGDPVMVVKSHLGALCNIYMED